MTATGSPLKENRVGGGGVGSGGGISNDFMGRKCHDVIRNNYWMNYRGAPGCASTAEAWHTLQDFFKPSQI